MDVRQAVRTAKEYLTDLYEGEHVTNIGLEEVVFEDKYPHRRWKITIGFSRPWDHGNALVATLADVRPSRTYKVISIDDSSGKVESLMDRVLKSSD